jgi:hypothetical protein
MTRGGVGADPRDCAGWRPTRLDCVKPSWRARGATSTAVVAHFGDADKATDPGQFTATIDRGGGTTSAGTVVANPEGGFDVPARHRRRRTGSRPRPSRPDVRRVELPERPGSLRI